MTAAPPRGLVVPLPGAACMDASLRRFSIFYFFYYAALGAYTPYVGRWVDALGHGGFVLGAEVLGCRFRFQSDTRPVGFLIVCDLLDQAVADVAELIGNLGVGLLVLLGHRQDLRVDGEPLCDVVARAVARWGAELPAAHGYSPVGAVVGATWPQELARLRGLLPQAWLLLPGVGAQGGKVAELAAAFDARGLGALVNQSRGVMQCFRPQDRDWLDRIAAAAAAFAAECRAVATGRSSASGHP